MKKTRTKKKDSAVKTANVTNGGECCRLKQAESSKISITTTQMTPEQERQWQSALGLLLDAMVRREFEGKDQVT